MAVLVQQVISPTKLIHIILLWVKFKVDGGYGIVITHKENEEL